MSSISGSRDSEVSEGLYLQSRGRNPCDPRRFDHISGVAELAAKFSPRIRG